MNTLNEKNRIALRNYTALGGLLASLLLSSGCAPSMATLNKYVTSQGFIPYNDPVQNAGPGTILGGSPSEVTFVASPQTCFPDKRADGTPTNLRDSYPTSLPSESSNIKATGSLSVQLTNLVTQLTGVVSFQGSASFSSLKQVNLQVGTAAIDTMNLVALQEYYEKGMSDDCKNYLNVTGFVLEGLKVNQLTFQFISSNGAAIDLTGSFAQSVSAGIAGSYQVQNNTSLVITSPTYLGFQLGSLRLGSNGFTLYRAADVASGAFDFQPLGIFPGTPGGSSQTPAVVAAAASAMAIDRYANYKR